MGKVVMFFAWCIIFLGLASQAMVVFNEKPEVSRCGAVKS